MALEGGPQPKFPENSLSATTNSSSPPEMARRTRCHAQHSNLPPPSADPVQEQGGQQDLNNLYAEEVPEHHPGKEPMVVDADDDANLRELMHRTERLKDMIGAIQTMVNQLNQFLVRVTGQRIQLLPILVRLAQQAPGPHSRGNRGTHEQADESQIELAGRQLHQRRRSHSPTRHRGDVR